MATVLSPCKNEKMTMLGITSGTELVGKCKLKESASKAVPVLAGYPTESIDTLKAADIADFIHIKTPALEYLKQCVDQLGGES